MDNNNVIAGQEVLIKSERHGRFRSYGNGYTKAIVTRTTKARIFVKSHSEHAQEREFNKDDLTERSKVSAWKRDAIVVAAEDIAKIEAEIAADQARRALENEGGAAFVHLASKFSPESSQGYRPLQNRTDDEIKALIAAVDTLMGLVK